MIHSLSLSALTKQTAFELDNAQTANVQICGVEKIKAYLSVCSSWKTCYSKSNLIFVTHLKCHGLGKKQVKGGTMWVRVG